MKIIIASLLLLSLSACSQDSKHPQDSKLSQDKNTKSDIKTTVYETKPELKKYFDEYKVTGSFMLYDVKNEKYIYYDSARCYKRFSPASTYKIPNSIIGLETGVIANENFVIPWDSVVRWNEAWNHDMDLKTAIKVSCVPYYQELARRVGKEKMQEYVNKFDYGNRDISGGIDKFWLENTMKISQAEQITFLKKLFDSELPVSKRSMDIVKNIIVLDERQGFTLKGKTGWAASDTIDIGWLVGWAENQNGVYIYATNIESKPENKSFAEARRKITENILKELGVMPE